MSNEITNTSILDSCIYDSSNEFWKALTDSYKDSEGCIRFHKYFCNAVRKIAPARFTKEFIDELQNYSREIIDRAIQNYRTENSKNYENSSDDWYSRIAAREIDEKIQKFTESVIPALDKSLRGILDYKVRSHNGFPEWSKLNPENQKLVKEAIKTQIYNSGHNLLIDNCTVSFGNNKTTCSKTINLPAFKIGKKERFTFRFFVDRLAKYATAGVLRASKKDLEDHRLENSYGFSLDGFEHRAHFFPKNLMTGITYDGQDDEARFQGLLIDLGITEQFLKTYRFGQSRLNFTRIKKIDTNLYNFILQLYLNQKIEEYQEDKEGYETVRKAFRFSKSRELTEETLIQFQGETGVNVNRKVVEELTSSIYLEDGDIDTAPLLQELQEIAGLLGFSEAATDYKQYISTYRPKVLHDPAVIKRLRQILRDLEILERSKDSDGNLEIEFQLGSTRIFTNTQRISKKSKEKIYIDSLDIDAVSSQTSIVASLYQALGLHTWSFQIRKQWLESDRKELAAKIGIDPSDLKKLILGLTMGAHFTLSPRELLKHANNPLSNFSGYTTPDEIILKNPGINWDIMEAELGDTIQALSSFKHYVDPAIQYLTSHVEKYSNWDNWDVRTSRRGEYWNYEQLQKRGLYCDLKSIPNNKSRIARLLQIIETSAIIDVIKHTSREVEFKAERANHITRERHEELVKLCEGSDSLLKVLGEYNPTYTVTEVISGRVISHEHDGFIFKLDSAGKKSFLEFPVESGAALLSAFESKARGFMRLLGLESYIKFKFEWSSVK